jgi:hypothetical protein
MKYKTFEEWYKNVMINYSSEEEYNRYINKLNKEENGK